MRWRVCLRIPDVITVYSLQQSKHRKQKTFSAIEYDRFEEVIIFFYPSSYIIFQQDDLYLLTITLIYIYLSPRYTFAEKCFLFFFGCFYQLVMI